MEEFEEQLTMSFDVPYSILIDKQTCIEVYPIPITEADKINIGGEIEPGNQSNTEYYSSTGLEAYYCSVHKATIPISAMIKLIDQDDQDQIVMFQCSTCSPRITCKRSPRITAISLQEMREQQVIEPSVDLDINAQKLNDFYLP